MAASATFVRAFRCPPHRLRVVPMVFPVADLQNTCDGKPLCSFAKKAPTIKNTGRGSAVDLGKLSEAGGDGEGQSRDRCQEERLYREAQDIVDLLGLLSAGSCVRFLGGIPFARQVSAPILLAEFRLGRLWDTCAASLRALHVLWGGGALIQKLAHVPSDKRALGDSVPTAPLSPMDSGPPQI